MPAPRSTRAAAGLIGALVQQSRHDPREYTAAGRAKFLERFVEQVDPNRELPELERARRAEAARKAYMRRLALRSAEIRRKGATG
jgi:hypothetical protein